MGQALYNGRQVRGQRQGHSNGLDLGRTLIQRSSSSNTILQPPAAAPTGLWVPDATSCWAHQLCLALGRGTALGMPLLSDVYSMRPDRSPPVRWCCFILQRSVLHPLLSVFVYSFIHICIFCPRLQWNQSWNINFSSEEFKWEPLSVPPFPLSK